jgi:hypothetical protein
MARTAPTCWARALPGRDRSRALARRSCRPRNAPESRARTVGASRQGPLAPAGRVAGRRGAHVPAEVTGEVPGPRTSRPGPLAGDDQDAQIVQDLRPALALDGFHVERRPGRSVNELAAVVLFALAGSASPGPDSALLWASGARFGFRRTVPHVLGTRDRHRGDGGGGGGPGSAP